MRELSEVIESFTTVYENGELKISGTYNGAPVSQSVVCSAPCIILFDEESTNFTVVRLPEECSGKKVMALVEEF